MIEWLLSPGVVLGSVGVLGILAVLLIAWGLAQSEPEEYRAMDRAFWASQRARMEQGSSRRRSPGR